MGELIGLGMTHFPPLSAGDERMKTAFLRMLHHPSNAAKASPSTWPEAQQAEWGEDEGLTSAANHRARLVADLRRVREEIDAFAPDFILVWGDDQYENFRESVIPPFCVLAYPEFRFSPWEHFHLGENVWGEPADREVVVAGAQLPAKRLIDDLLRSGFDMSYAYRPNEFAGLSHAFANTVLYLDYDRRGFDYPIVPMAVNCYGRLVVAARGLFVDPDKPPTGDELDPASPSPARCFDLGGAIARALAASPWRVALVASASWSHGFLTRANDYLFPSAAADKKLFDALVAGDWDAWRNYTLDEVEANGQQEMLNWMCLAGAAAELEWGVQWADFVGTHIFNSNKAFTVLR